MTFNDVEFKACPRCGVEPKVEDVRERSLDRPNVMSVTCPSCGMSNRIAWGSLMATPQKEAVSMLVDSWNSRRFARRWSCTARPPGTRCPIWCRVPRAGRSRTAGRTRRG